MWFKPSMAQLIDKDILESAAEAQLMDAEVIQLQLARAIHELAEAMKK